MSREDHQEPRAAVDSAFVGAEHEENLAIRGLAAAVRQRGWRAAIVPFNRDEDLESVAGSILRLSPSLVGLSMAFQHRAGQFLKLAAKLRAGNFKGHICAGGHFPTATSEELLRRNPAVDTVVFHDGEEIIVRLMEVLDDRKAWASVPSMAWRAEDGAIARSGHAEAPRNLDLLPLPARDGSLRVHVGRSFTTLSGSRGCYGGCFFCAINCYNRSRPGPRLRFRSPESVAREMAWLYHEKGARIFCFHDDTWLLPSPKKTEQRLGLLAVRLGEMGVERIATVAKCRPDALTGPLLRFLKERLGLVRLYVGVENFSPAGLEHLGRGMDRETVEGGLALCREADLYCCYNILLFEPDTVLDDVRENIRGMERFPGIPVNFSRTEAYNGTPIWAKLKREGRLQGNYLYAGYKIKDPAVEALFAIVSQAFKDRNFSADALANMNSSLGYEIAVLRFFAGGDGGETLADLSREVSALNAAVNVDTLSRLKEALGFVEKGGWRDRRSMDEFTIDL